MIRIFVAILAYLSFLWMSPVFAQTFTANTNYSVCFTPQQNCTSEIVALINSAKKNIYIQAYSFTSRAIAKALVRAFKRGVTVKVIVDRSELDRQHFSLYGYLKRYHIPMWCDDTVSIAHNKVIIVDRLTVETGSFNFTYAAQHYNAENILIVHDQRLATSYYQNWLKRVRLSHPV